MKKKMLFKFALLNTTVLLFSCSNEMELKLAEPPKEIIVNVEQKIAGDLGQYCLAANERVKFSFSKIEEGGSFPSAGYKYQIPVKINFEVAKTIKAGMGYNHYGPSLDIEFLDKNGNKIEFNELTISMRTTYEDLASYIKSGNSTELILFDSQYTVDSFFGDADKSLKRSQAFLDNFARVAKIRLKSEIIAEKFDTSANSDVDYDTDYSENSSRNSCQKFLDDYEKVYLENVDLSKEIADNPNNTAKYSVKLIELSRKMSKIEGDIRKCGDKEIIKKMTEISLKASQKFY